MVSKSTSKEEYVFDALEGPVICEQTTPCPHEQTKETLWELSLPLGDDPFEQDSTVDLLNGFDSLCLKTEQKINSY